MNTTWTLVCVGVGWTTLCVLLADLVRGTRSRVNRRIRQATRVTSAPTDESFALFRDWRLSDETAPGFAGRVRTYIAQAGLPWRVGHFLIGSLACAGVGLVAGLCFAPVWAWIPAVGLAVLPTGAVHLVRQRRIARLRRELPDAFDGMRRSVEAGQSVASAFQQVATQSRGALAEEFQRCGEQQNLGLSQDAALRELARRVPIVELNIFVIALLLQRQTGGSPVEILSNMAALVRKRLRLDQRVQSLTAEGRLQALVLTVLPIAAFVGLVIFRRDYVAPLLARPQLLGLLALGQIVGSVWVRRTIRLEY